MSSFDKDSLLKIWERWERPISTVSLVAGFVFDLFIAKRPDSVYDNALLIFYLLVAATCIVILNKRALQPKKVDGIHAPDPQPLILLLILQFCFGGLASNLLVLYGHSGTLLGGLLFYGVLGGMMLGNEFLRDRYSQLRFNLAVYYMLLLTYLTIAVPTFLLHQIGWLAFIVSGALSIAIMALFFFILSGSARLFRGAYRHKRMLESAAIVGAIFIFFNIFYAAKLIPPVPLSLKSIGVYHALIHSSSGYEASLEPAPWWQFWAATSGTYHTTPDQPAYCFSSIFAPTGLSTPIVHQWEWQNQATGQWISEARVTFPITGGNARGYFGYSIKSLDHLGPWRCDVETASGELIGQTSFTAVAGAPALLVQKTL